METTTIYGSADHEPEELISALTGAKQALHASVNTDRFIDAIMTAPNEIHVRQEAFRIARRNLDAANMELKNAEALMIALISSTTGLNGKALYSNAEARQAELIVQKAGDPEYKLLQKEYDKAFMEMEQAQFGVTLAENKFKAYQTAGAILAARLS